MKKIIVISTSLRTGSNSDMLADQFIKVLRLQVMKWKRFILRAILPALCSAEALTLHAPLRATRNCRKLTSWENL